MHVSDHFTISFLAARAEQALVEKPSALAPPRLKKHKHAEKNDSRGLQDRSDKDGLSVFTYFWFHTEDSSGGGKPQGLPILGTSCFKATVLGGGSGGGWWVCMSGAESPSDPPLIKHLLQKSHIFT